MSSISFGSSNLSTNHPRKDQIGRERKLLTHVLKSRDWIDPVLSDKSFIVIITIGFAEIVYSLMGPWGDEMR